MACYIHRGFDVRNPTITIRDCEPVSSWGRHPDGRWLTFDGQPLTRDEWANVYLQARGRPPAIPRDRWDDAKRLRLLWLGGAVTTLEVARALGLLKRTAARFLDFQSLWWL